MASTNVIVMGKTGIGKSTLVNAIFDQKITTEGIGGSVTRGIQAHHGITKLNGYEFCLYDTEGIELKEEQQEKILKQIKDCIQKCIRSNDHGFIHAIWYCINSTGSRIEDTEMEIIKTLISEFNVKVCVVLTQAFQQKKVIEMCNAIENLGVLKEKIEANQLQVIPVLAKDYEIDEGKYKNAFGLNELERETIFSRKNGEVNGYQQKVDEMEKDARKYAKNYIGATILTGMSPIPFSDAAVLVPVQVAMLAKINSIFEITMEEGTLKKLAEMAIKIGGTAFVGKTLVSNVFKMIPGIGTLAGGAISATVAGTLTTVLANNYINALKKRKRDEFYNLVDSEESFIKEVVIVTQKEL